MNGVLVLPLRRFDDPRGWFMELRRESLLPDRTLQTNVSFSRAGTVRGLHYHARGQNDLFVCVRGMIRVVALDQESGETFSVDVGDDNPAAVWIPGHFAHGFEALTDALVALPRHRASTTRPIRTSTASRGTTSASATSGARASPILSDRDRDASS